MRDKVSPALFILVIICFLLPFVDLSCGGQTLTLNGFDFVTGINIMDDREPPNPLAVAAVVMALAGAALCFWKSRWAQIIQSVIAIMGFLTLLTMKITFDRKVLGEGDAPIQIEWRIGYYLALLVFAGVAAYDLYQTFGGKGVSVGTDTGASASLTICPHCHRGNEPGSKWCQWCGGSMQAHREVNQADDRGRVNVPFQSAMLTQPVGAPPPAPSPPPSSSSPTGALTEPVRPAQPVVPIPPAGDPRVTIEESPTTPLRTDFKPAMDMDTSTIGFLRVERIGRCELIPILKSEFLIGSQNGTDYQEHSGDLGPIHARIEKANDGYYISSQQADGVISINDQKLGPTHMYPLRPGDVIRLGNVEYIFDLA